ncbi:tail fiber domain-containing protein, partial [Candidatus Pacearchaeota archaeon]|nr:tail fiber domain-containing protein [Candidatus Pacearchaeota archaeon]
AAAVSAAAYNVVTDLAADVTAAGSADTTLIVSDIQTLSANLTIPTNITLDIKHSGQITGAYTLTINGGIVAGSNQRIFGDSVTVSIVDCVDSISPNWWGFSVSETAANNATYLQAAIDAPLNGGRVRMIPGAYSIDEITFAANNLLIFEGSGWDTVLTYAGTSDFATITINAQSGLIVRDFKVVGSATTGHCFVTNVGQCQFDNLFVSGFSQANKAAFFTTGELYNLSITNSRVQDCYDGIYFNHGATTSCNFENLFIRGWTRYGIALLGTAPLPSYSNRIVSCIIDEPVGSTGTAGIYFQRNYTSIIENCFFESETKAIHCNIAGNTSIRGNTFGSGITTAIQLDAGVGDTILKLNRYLSGSITDSGIRTYHLDDALHHGIGQAPEAWSSDYAALQMGGNAAWYSQYVQGTSNASWFTNNAYYDGSHRYIVNDQVSAYLQSDGAHYFYGAAPAAADSVISWALGFSISVDGLLTALPTYSSIVGGTNRDLYIDDTGLIGYVSSSKRYKENVVDMGDTSWVYKLRPVRFDYIQEQGGHHSYGLIAEEVSLISEYLVTRDKEGREESVEYSKLTPILLNEVLFLRERIQQLEQRKSIFSSLVDFLRKIFKYGNIKLQHNKRR